MADGKCTKSFPKNFNNDTVTNVDGYPIYRRRSPDNGGQSKYIKNSCHDLVRELLRNGLTEFDEILNIDLVGRSLCSYLYLMPLSDKGASINDVATRSVSQQSV
jgi:hypothetical protein